MTPETERLRLPALPPPARRAGVPLLAVLAPVAMAGVLWVMTSSPYALVFGCFGPLIAIIGWFEGRRARRRERRAALEEARRALEEIALRLDERAGALRLALQRRASGVQAHASGHTVSSPVLRLGVGSLPSGIEFEGDETHRDPEWATAVSGLRERAAFIGDAPVLADASHPIAVDGPGLLVRAFARSLLLQVLAALPVDGVVVLVPYREPWMVDLPHEIEHGGCWEVVLGDRRVLRLREGAGVGLDTVSVRLGDEADRSPRVEAPRRVGDLRPALVGASEAGEQARRIAERARRDGWSPATDVPARVEFSSLPSSVDRSDGTLAAVVGVDAGGAVELDLDRYGPHALVAGTTGSGKSELLVTWVLALARDRSPQELSLLLVDFKGGASFAPLARLPHVVGMVSDLDPDAATRAVASLRAELRRREEQLALHGVRSIGELPRGILSRLVIVVDEYAALVSLDAALQAVFSDLASRGRSLGLHLILCTQRPSGVVRESVLANITLRVCLRVLDTADSVAVLGHAGAVRLRPEQRGRGLLSGTDGAQVAQFALSTTSDADSVSERWRSHPRSEGRPWLEPLSAQLRADDLEMLPASDSGSAGIVVGAVDLPERQRQERLSIDPWSDGAVLVIGASGAGRTTALRMLGSAAGCSVRWVPDDPAELWQALTRPPDGPRSLVVADDLDRTLAWAQPEARAELAELIARAARDTRRSGVAIVASARSGGGSMHAVQAAFEQRLVLRVATREEHLLAGGELARFRADRRPGSCVWRGAEAQIAVPEGMRPKVWRAPLPLIDPAAGAWSIVSPRPGDLAARLTAEGTTVADVDGWLADHAALAAARRAGRLLFVGCSPSDHRTLTRARTPLPPLASDDEAWHFDGESTTRVRLTAGGRSGEAER